MSFSIGGASAPQRTREAAKCDPIRDGERRVGVIRQGRFVPHGLEASFPLLQPHAVSTRQLVGASACRMPDGSRAFRVEEVLGLAGEAVAEEDAILFRASLGESTRPHQARITHAAPSLTPREDLRARSFVTIDPDGCTDHDDAIDLEALADGVVRVRVAIADVASFVPEGSALDHEARRRGSTIYLPGRMVPMLPHAIATDAASLRPELDRPALVLTLDVAPDGAVLSRSLCHAWIRSRADLRYGDVAALLAGGPTTPAVRARSAMLRALDALASVLRAARRERGALALSRSEVTTVIGPRGEPLSMIRSACEPSVERAHVLVEELMLLANEQVALILRGEGAETLFRAHAEPERAAIREVARSARRAGVAVPAETGAGMRSALAALPEGETRTGLERATLAATRAANYDHTPGSHFALATRDYLHFTSPIRRYPDLCVHRAIHALLAGAPLPGAPPTEEVNATQARARAVHREVAALHGALLCRSRVGDEIEGVVAHVGPRFAIVSIDDPAVSVGCSLRASRRRSLEVGARATVRLTSVSVETRRIAGEIVRAG